MVFVLSIIQRENIDSMQTVLRDRLQLVCHSDELQQRLSLHLFHQLTPMHLDSGFTGTKFCSASARRADDLQQGHYECVGGKWNVDNTRRIKFLSGEMQLWQALPLRPARKLHPHSG
jgi:hypothetical protein